jgi:hypothetical protein
MRTITFLTALGAATSRIESKAKALRYENTSFYCLLIAIGAFNRSRGGFETRPYISP